MITATVETRLRYEIEDDTTFLFSVTAARTRSQRPVEETVRVEPNLDVERVDYDEAATHQLLRIRATPGELALGYDAVVEVLPTVQDPHELSELRLGDLPAGALPYLNPSRYCASDRLGDLASRLFDHLEPGFDRVVSVRDWVETNLTYVSGSTTGDTDATDVLVHRAGVCRDYAHVMISLCRALGIPARYVSGYGIGVVPPDFHGFVEVFLSDGWYLMDPTGMSPPNGLVRIAYGRDAADTPFATFEGSARLLDKTVGIDATLEPADENQPTTTA